MGHPDAARPLLDREWRDRPHHVLKIARAEGAADPRAGAGITFSGPQGCGTPAAKAFIIPFFIFHYGLFWIVHGVFVFLLPLFAGLFSMFTTEGPFGLVRSDPGLSGPAVSIEALLLAALALTISHTISFYLNYIRRGEYRTVSVMTQMARPYGRVVILHLTILLGAVLVAALGQPMALLVLLVVLKAALDLILHLRSHRSASDLERSARHGLEASLVRSRNLRPSFVALLKPMARQHSREGAFSAPIGNPIGGLHGSHRPARGDHPDHPGPAAAIAARHTAKPNDTEEKLWITDR